jgi:RNA polymerase sigma factor (sigma-70 family)
LLDVFCDSEKSAKTLRSSRPETPEGSVRFSKNLTSIEPSQPTEDDPIRLPHQAGIPAAAASLLPRHFQWVRRIIAKEARRVGLARTDTEDAQQEGLFAFWHAVAKFETSERPGCCSFRTFLWVVVMDRFRDYVRRLRRWEDHYDRTVRPEDLEGANRNEQDWADERENPVSQLTGQEFQRRLDQAIKSLKPQARMMWEQLAAGQPLRAIAAELQMSYDQGKRLRQRVLADLAQELRSWTD